MIESPWIVEVPAQLTAMIRLTIPRSEIQRVMGPGIQEVIATVLAQKLTPTGRWFTHHLRVDPAIFDFAICMPVPRPITAVGRVQPGHLPAATTVRTVHHGPYEGLGAAWGSFKAWIAAAGHRPTQDLWERYLVGPESEPDPAAWRTELNQPLAPA